jgi:hypothetical protein
VGATAAAPSVAAAAIAKIVLRSICDLHVLTLSRQFVWQDYLPIMQPI